MRDVGFPCIGRLPPERDFDTEILRFDRQIGHVVESLASVGKSEALIAKLTELEDHRAYLSSAAESATVPLIADAEGHWEALVSDLENLHDYAMPDELEKARELIREIVGEVEVREEPDGVFAYTRLNTVSGYESGAQERT